MTLISSFFNKIKGTPEKGIFKLSVTLFISHLIVIGFFLRISTISKKETNETCHISHYSSAMRYEDYSMKCGTNFCWLNNETKEKLDVVFFQDSNVVLVEFIVAIQDFSEVTEYIVR